MTVTLLAVGKLGEPYWVQAAAEYAKRLSGFCKLEIVEIPEARLPRNPSPGDVAKALEQEGKAILSKLPSRAGIAALCIEGVLWSSERLAGYLETAAGEVSRLAFVIGGSHGLSEEVKARAHHKLSFSPMTFPHQLARIMALEQLYRAFTINGNLPYHK